MRDSDDIDDDDNLEEIPIREDLANLQVGETLWLDRGYLNECLITIVRFRGKYFCEVKDEEGNQWTTMIYRLSKP